MTETKIKPDHTAVRTALWRGLHLKIDSAPYIFSDDLGAKIINELDWETRPDMDPERSLGPRASIVARARLIEDLLEKEIQKGVSQYVILGAGIDTFAFRRNDLIKKIKIFEVDQEGPQTWKKNRLNELNFSIPDELIFVPVNFEKENWLSKIQNFGFDILRPTLVVSTGVTMYLSNEANLETFRQINKLSKGSIFITTFMLPPEMLESKEKELMLFTMDRAKQSGTPFISLYSPEDILKLSKQAGIDQCEIVPAEYLSNRYFKNRSDQLTLGKAENFLILRTSL